MGVKGIIFDFDGTIVSQEIDFKAIFQQMQQLLRSYNLKEPEAKLPILEYLKEVERLNGNSAKEFLINAHKLLLEREKQASKNAKPIKGIPEFLNQLSKNSFAIGIVTRNSKKVVSHLLKKKNLCCHCLLAREDVPEVKPHPLHIEMMRRKLKIRKDETLVVGDHPFDIIAAKKAGVLSCGVLSGGKTPQDFADVSPDFIYNDITELGGFLGIKKLPTGKLEQQLLRYLLGRYCTVDSSVLTGPGIGIDAAVVKTDSNILIMKSDPITLVSKDIGEYAVSINSNDVVCLGAQPKWLLTTLIFPEGTTFPEIEKVFSDISHVCKKQKISWIGGHTEISNSVSKPVISCAIAGERIKGIKIIEKAMQGDVLIAVKQIGIEGASILAREEPALAEKFPYEVKKALDAIKKPGISIVKEAIFAWKTIPVVRMHDPTEGGIAAGIAELAESINCGFIIEEEKIPLYKPAKVFSDYLGLNVFGLISSGCLLIVARKKDAEKLLSLYKKQKIPAAIIGHVIDEKKLLIKRENGDISFLKYSSQDEIVRNNNGVN